MDDPKNIQAVRIFIHALEWNWCTLVTAHRGCAFANGQWPSQVLFNIQHA